MLQSVNSGIHDSDGQVLLLAFPGPTASHSAVRDIPLLSSPNLEAKTSACAPLPQTALCGSGTER